MVPFQWALDVIEAGAAWEASGHGDGSIVVAVIDTGLNFEHEDLRDAVWTNPGEIPDNGVDDEGNGFIDDYRGWVFSRDEPCEEDFANHGTPVSGVIAARADNGRGIAGLADVRIMVLCAGGPPVSAIIEANYYAVDMGADVINFSLGTYTFVEEWNLAIEYSAGNDVSVIGAAGNDGIRAPLYPAAFQHVIGVAASTRDDSRWVDSNYGSWLDVAAPGGVGVLTCDGDDPRGYRELGGTSIAAPHASGLVALVRSIAPDLSARKTRAFVQEGADDLGDPGFDEQFGYGRINAGTTVAIVLSDLRCSADLSRNGRVDFADVLALLPSFGTEHWSADINDDGMIGFADLIDLLTAWGDCGQPMGAGRILANGRTRPDAAARADPPDA